MGFFDDFASAMESYPHDFVTLEIIEVDVPGNALNEGEVGSYRIQVRNTGPLDMADLTVRIRGLNGVLVKNNGAAAPLVDEVVTVAGQFPTIKGHNGDAPQENTGSPLGFKAPSGQRPVIDLFEVSVEGWTGELDHALVSHSRPAPDVKAIYRDRVRAA
jgi:hypothetical protein